jgi:hypothetical protein
METGVGNNRAVTMTAWAGGDIGEATENALLYAANFALAITVGASLGVCAWPATDTMTHAADFNAPQFDFFICSEHCLLKRDGQISMKIVTLPWYALSGRSSSTEKGIEYVSKPTKVKFIETSPVQCASSPVPVIGGSLSGVGKHLIGLVYFFELFRGTRFFIMIRVVLEG